MAFLKQVQSLVTNQLCFCDKSWKRLQHADLSKVKEIRQEATVSFDAPEISLDAAGAASLSALGGIFHIEGETEYSVGVSW